MGAGTDRGAIQHRTPRAQRHSDLNPTEDSFGCKCGAKCREPILSPSARHVGLNPTCRGQSLSPTGMMMLPVVDLMRMVGEQ